MSNFEIYTYILGKEVSEFNSYFDRLENEMINTELSQFVDGIDLITKCKTILKTSELQNEIGKLKHLTAEHFAYSSLEAFKNTVNPTMRDLGYVRIYNFPHNTETNTKFIDDRLVHLFEIAYNNFINSSQDNKIYRSTAINYNTRQIYI